jgi:uncharacterized membrane-anchored protein YitT (DUF2179 family)
LDRQQNLMEVSGKPTLRNLWSWLFNTDRSRSIESIQRRRTMRRVKKQLRNQLRDMFLVLLGVTSAGFGLRGFLMPNGFIDGGVMGISLLVNSQTRISLSLLILLINLPFIYLAYRQISPSFGVKSIIASSLWHFIPFLLTWPQVKPLILSWRA